MNDTPQGDGNLYDFLFLNTIYYCSIRMNDTPQGDGNKEVFWKINKSCKKIRMNDTPQGDGNLNSLKPLISFVFKNKNEWYSARRRKLFFILFIMSSYSIRMNDTPQGDGNYNYSYSIRKRQNCIRMNDTPQGDGNLDTIEYISNNTDSQIRMNDTPQGDGNFTNFSSSIALISPSI